MLVRKHLLSISAVCGGVLLLGVLTPKAVHAVAAALVQVTNTTASPVPVWQAKTAASQQILLQTPFGGTVVTGSQVTMVQLSPTQGITNQNGYTVPAGQNLVVTGVDLILYAKQTSPAFLRINIPNQGVYASEYFNELAAGMQQFKFDNGLVYPAGTQVIFDNSGGTANMEVVVRGYLTAQ